MGDSIDHPTDTTHTEDNPFTARGDDDDGKTQALVRGEE